MKIFSIIIPLILLVNGSILAQHKNILIDDTGTPNEPTICINTIDPSQLVAGSNIHNVYISADTGKTWQEKRLRSDYGVWGDPAITIDTNGYFYFFHLSNADAWIDRIVCQKSMDGGNNWNDGTFMGHINGKQQDKEWPIVDSRNNNIYVTWTQFDNYGSSSPSDSSQILFSKSTDAGDSWTPVKRINKISGDCIDDDNTVEGAVPAVGPNGEIYVSWAGPLGLTFDRSVDEGETWLENDIHVTSFPGGWNYEIPGISRCNGLPVTVCDLSDSEHRGTIYINWTDQRNGENDTDVWLVKSTDQGNTWSEPKRVNDDLPGKQQFFTWVTIDKVTGYLYFTFYDRRNHENDYTDVYMAVSKDGGESFNNFKISETPFLPKKEIFFGDYTNITAHNNIIRPIWTRLDGYNLSIWTALIDVDSMTTSIQEQEFSEDFLELYQNSPNPYSDKTAVSFKIKKPAIISLTLFDSLGNKISDYIKNQPYQSGKHIIVIDNKELLLKPGIYLYSLKVGQNIKSGKMIISE